jgi:hypothetical protein
VIGQELVNFTFDGMKGLWKRKANLISLYQMSSVVIPNLFIHFQMMILETRNPRYGLRCFARQTPRFLASF